MPQVSSQPFRDRAEAGDLLATRLSGLADRDDVVVLALPRGGVPVGYEVARSLRVAFDVFVVRKLGVPGHEELAMGAIASGGVRLVNHDVVDSLGVPQNVIDQVAKREQVELERRERLYRGTRPLIPLANRTVVLVDDGLATGSTMRAAVTAVRRQQPARLIVAVPVGASSDLPGVGRRGRRSDLPALARSLCSGRTVVPRLHPDVGRRGPYAAGQERTVTRPSSNLYRHLVSAATGAAVQCCNSREDVERIVNRLGPAGVYLIGEASHGTQDFYNVRASITKHLIEHQGVTAVALEADWPDAYRVNRFVRGEGPDADANAALSGFERFPSWMWRNTEVLSFVRWLREWNDRHADRKVGVYGLDLYSLRTSVQAVIAYLDKVDPEAADRARARYACFDHYAGDTHAYGYAASAGIVESCEDAKWSNS